LKTIITFIYVSDGRSKKKSLTIGLNKLSNILYSQIY